MRPIDHDTSRPSRSYHAAIEEGDNNTMRQERWHDVPGYEGRYQVSTQGRVKSLARIDDGGASRRTRILSPRLQSGGRRHYVLCKRGVVQWFSASVLMAMAYRIPNPSGFRYVIHRNSDAMDFRRENLAWASLVEKNLHGGHKMTSRYLGVTRSRLRAGRVPWIATLNVDKRRYRLGQYATPEEAAYVYDCEVKRRGLDRPINGVRKPKRTTWEVRSLSGEIWRPFPGAEATHRISNRGRVKTAAYVTSNGQRVLPKLRRISVHTSGHRTVLIRDVRYNIARILADVFPSSARGAASPHSRSTSAPGPS